MAHHIPILRPYFCLNLSFFIRHFLISEIQKLTASLSPVSLCSLNQGQKMLVEDSDTYTLTSIGREDAGEYKCSLADSEKMEASQNIVVNCEY